MKKGIVAIIQARMGSTRLPGKSLLKLGKKTVLEHVIERAMQSKQVNSVVVATTIHKSDDVIASLCRKRKIPYYRGSVNNVLKRFYKAAEISKAEQIVRCCGDTPFLDTAFMNRIIRSHLKKRADLTYVVQDLNVLWGVATCIFTYGALKSAYENAKSSLDKEHVTLYMLDHPEKYKINPVAPYKYMLKPYRVTLDTKEDYIVIKKVYEALFYPNNSASTQDIIKYLDGHPEVAQINAHIKQRHV